jgi:hypothetical protein
VPDLATFQTAFAAAMGRTSRRGALELQPGFAVYRNTAPCALIDVLRAAYPVTAEILGEDGFGHTAFAFARAHPPTDPILIGYGAGFADFIAEQDFAADLPYLAEIAAIERLGTESHMAADAAPLDLRDLTAIGAENWASLRLPLHPAARFDWLSTPALTIWQAHLDGFETLEPEWRAEGVLVTRPAGQVLATPIGAPAHRLLFGLRLRETLGQAMAATASVYPEADIASILTALVNSGAFARPPHLERN